MQSSAKLSHYIQDFGRPCAGTPALRIIYNAKCWSSIQCSTLPFTLNTQCANTQIQSSTGPLPSTSHPTQLTIYVAGHQSPHTSTPSSGNIPKTVRVCCPSLLVLLNQPIPLGRDLSKKRRPSAFGNAPHHVQGSISSNLFDSLHSPNTPEHFSSNGRQPQRISIVTNDTNGVHQASMKRAGPACPSSSHLDYHLEYWFRYTGCIEGFVRAENCHKNMMKSINTISLFCILRSVIKFKLFQRSWLTQQEKIEFNYTF